MDNLTETMDLNLNNSMQSHELEEDLMFLYMFILPIILFGCLLTFVLNLVIILAFPLIRNLSKVSVAFTFWVEYHLKVMLAIQVLLWENDAHV